MLYQQNQKIEVIVRKEEGVSIAEKEETTPDESGGGGKSWKDAVFGSSDPRRIKRIAVTNATHAYAVGKQILGMAENYAITGLGYKHGDEAYQDIVQRQFEQAKDVLSIGSSVVMGAVYGAWGGPLGAVLGATFGAVSSVASIGFRDMNREREYSVKQFKQENGIAYQRARAGINLTTGRLR